MKKVLFIACSALLSVVAFDAMGNSSVLQNSWTAATAPIQARIIGGPWTLGQGPTTKTIPSVGYCINGVSQSNIGINLMQPYYYPFVIGSGKTLQGYFDYRPKDSNETIVAANSKDGGLTWTFQKKALELNPGLCPASDTQTNAQTYPATTKPFPYPNPPASNVLLSDATGSPGATDNGQGHPTVLTILGVSRLYTLDRSVNPADKSVDNAGLVVHTITSLPLNGVQPTSPDTESNKGERTTGLLNPDGIIAEVPGSYPRIVLYVQKQLKADSKLLSPNQLCSSPTIGYQKGKAPNTDYVTVRLAKTTDGVNFTDLGAVNGLNDQADTSLTGTRYIASRGTLISLPGNRYGLFFSGGNCLDADSDAFHYIGYAESNNLRDWKVINGLNNPIASVQNTQVTDPSGPAIPLYPPLIPTETWFQQRVYTPNAIISRKKQITLIFAGYGVKSPSSDYSNYRTITQVVLNSALPLRGFESDDDDKSNRLYNWRDDQ